MEQQMQSEKNPKNEYFKSIAIMMGVFFAVPALGFLLVFPLVMPLLAFFPMGFVLIPFAFLAYLGIAAYWFFKKSGLYQKMIHNAARYGMQRSNRMMKEMPELKKEMMNNEAVRQFRQGLKDEVREEIVREMQNKRQEKQASPGFTEQE